MPPGSKPFGTCRVAVKPAGSLVRSTTGQSHPDESGTVEVVPSARDKVCAEVVGLAFLILGECELRRAGAKLGRALAECQTSDTAKGHQRPQQCARSGAGG